MGLLSWLWVLVAPAFGADLTASQQALLMLKVVGYDRNVHARGDTQVSVGVLIGARGRGRAQGREMSGALRDLVADGLELQGRQVAVVDVVLDEDEDPSDTIRRSAVSVLYVVAAVEDLEAVSAITRSLDILTFTSVADAVPGGLSVALLAEGDRAQLLIGLDSAREEGADLSAELLDMATVIR